MPDRILVTGGAGFVGSHLARALRRRYPEAAITAFDNLKRSGSELNLPRLRAAEIGFVHGDVREPRDLDALQADLIVECSAEPSAQAGYGSSPDYVVRTNLFGAYHCFDLARRTGADVLFLSSSRVYPVAALNRLAFHETGTRYDWLDGQPVPGASSLGIAEEFPTAGPRSIYGMTKLAGELILEEFADAYGFRYVINRCGLIAGPWQMGKVDQGVVALWMAAHHFDLPLRYIGFGGVGKQVRDILHVDDLSELALWQIEHLDQVAGRTFNVGGGRDFSLSLVEMTALCEELTGRHLAIVPVAEDRAADLRIYLTDTRRVQQACGWRPTKSPRQVLSDVLDWIRTNEPLVGKTLAG